MRRVNRFQIQVWERFFFVVAASGSVSLKLEAPDGSRHSAKLPITALGLSPSGHDHNQIANLK